ncbi:hypothetical protein Bpfe_010737 [Biomphalaria pfeifferi]|uniref:Uncharacterized protein n=1 Tax=Biomphalaria pfeifferi TaxID=112525 RepID=A0AAD8BSI7_BIOPF|nr:hypothetical protein Bpfe_010737 [Biomphalaria pfeifferi]
MLIKETYIFVKATHGCESVRIVRRPQLSPPSHAVHKQLFTSGDEEPLSLERPAQTRKNNGDKSNGQKPGQFLCSTASSETRYQGASIVH